MVVIADLTVGRSDLESGQRCVGISWNTWYFDRDTDVCNLAHHPDPIFCHRRSTKFSGSAKSVGHRSAGTRMASLQLDHGGCAVNPILSLEN